jgi:photosystem II stability/assembly factor-like uncharacterized protein
VRFLRCIGLIFLCLLLDADTNVFAQWKNISPNLLGKYPAISEGGVMVYRFGKVWAGVQGKLWMSSDDGNTWNDRTPFNFTAPSTFFDIDFFDGNTGIVSLDNGIIVMTKNAGLTWKDISPPSRGRCYGAKFIGSADEIALGYNGSAIGITRDAGATWTWSTFPKFNECDDIHTDRNGTVYAMMVGGNLRSSIIISSDYGASWQITAGKFDVDCRSFALDPCDTNTFYVANEEFYNITDNIRTLYISNDRGNSWYKADSKPFDFLCGSVIATQNSTIYFQTMNEGIRRSTDGGQTWRTIGGPSGMKDSRLVAAKDDNILFALDANGSIWKTGNSGGDSILVAPGKGILTVSRNVLFEFDTLFICSTPISQFLKFVRTGNCPPRILKATVEGIHSSSYSISFFAGDSLSVDYIPQTGGDQDAKLILTLNDGTQDTIVLKGVGIAPHPLALSTTDQATDTLGGSVNVPITISGLDHGEDIDLILHYDSKLIYNGSYSTTNVKLDLPGEQWSGRSKLYVAQARPDMILGYSRFTVFNDSLTKSQVTFDSVSVITAISPCQYLLPVFVSSTITPPSGCGIDIVSHFIHTGEIPQLSLMPNPTTGEVSVISSADLGEGNITIYDMLGTQRGTKTVSLAKNIAAKLLLPSANGIYCIRITAAERTYDLRAVVNH